MRFFIGALKVVILLGILTTLHELGHLFVAKLFRMKVLKYSIGFGPTLLKKQGKETEYSIRVIPLGGFVQLQGDDEYPQDSRAFPNKPVWQRILVLIAGAIVNFLVAIIIFTCIFMKQNEYSTLTISDATAKDVLASYGLEVGEEIYKVNGKRIYTVSELSDIILNSDSDEFKFELLDVNGNKIMKDVTIPSEEVGFIGVTFDLSGKIDEVFESSPAEEAGIKSGDTIVSINYGDTTISFEEFINAKLPSNATIDINLLRNGENVSAKVNLISRKVRYFNLSFVTLQGLDFLQNMKYALSSTASIFKTYFSQIKLVFQKSENVKFVGFIGIGKELSRTQSLLEFFELMGSISLALGFVNLLPIPGLDGGKILIVFIELIRRKPIKKELELGITLTGIAVLLVIAIYVAISDILSLF